MENPGVLQLAHELTLGVTEARWLNFTLVPGITLVVLDWLLTLELEVSLIWSLPWSGTKLLFFLTRYLPFIDISVAMYYQFGFALPQHVCKMAFGCFAWTFVIGQCFAVLILTIRTWAVCGKGRRSSYGLFGIYGVASTTFLVLMGLYWRSSTFRASPYPHLIGCIAEANGPYLASIYVILMFYEGGLLLLMAAQGVSALREVGRSQLTKVVYRDGILYYVYIFGLSLVNTVAIFRLQDAYKTMLVPIERVTYSILACRVILHIREQGVKEGQTILPAEQITAPIRFAQATQRTGQATTTDFSEGSSSRA